MELEHVGGQALQHHLVRVHFILLQMSTNECVEESLATKMRVQMDLDVRVYRGECP